VAKVTIGFDDYEGQQYDEYQGDDPAPGKWFDAEVVRAKWDDNDGDPQIVFYTQIVDHPDFAGWTRGWYADIEGDRKWKSQEMLRALQGGAEKAVTLDWENERAVENFLKKASRIRIMTGEYNDRINIRKVRPLLNNAVGAKKASKAAAPAPAPEPEDDSNLEPYTEAELMAIEDIGELEEILEKEFEVKDEDFPAQPRRDPDGSKYKKALVEAILEEQDGDDNQDAVEDAAEAGDDGDGFDDGFDDGAEPEAAPEPPARTRRGAAKKAAPAAKAAAAPAARTRRTRR
jgi:hypothetical protein